MSRPGPAGGGGGRRDAADRHVDGTPKPALAALRGANEWLAALEAPGARAVTVTPVADATAQQQSPTKALGHLPALEVDTRTTDGMASSRATTYLRFQLPVLAPGETVSAATLTLHVTDGTNDGPTIWRTATQWSEKTLTWRKGTPARIGTAPVYDMGQLPPGDISIPLALTGSPEHVSLELNADVPDGMTLSSREAPTVGVRPRLTLVITSS